MKKLLTLILLATSFILVTINTHASGGTLVTLTPETGTIGASDITYDFDGTYITLNGTYTSYEYLRILDYNATVINDNYYEAIVTHISGDFTFTEITPKFNFGSGDYFVSNPMPLNGDSFSAIIQAGSTGTYGRLMTGTNGTGSFTNYKMKVELYELPSVTELQVIFYDDASQLYTKSTVYLTTKEPTQPTKEGYYFLGWYEDQALTIKHVFGTTISSNLSLYAKFVPETTIAQDLSIIPVTNGASADFHLREENSKAYLVNTSTLTSIDHTLLSQSYETASTISVSSEKTFYNIMVVENDGFVDDIYTLPTLPETEELKIWFDATENKLRFNHGTLQESIPLTYEFTIYFANYDTFMLDHNKVTYQYDEGSIVKYLNLDELAYSFTLGNDTNEIRVWYADPEFTTPFDFTQPLSGDITVYGQWVDKTTGEPIEDQTPTDPTDPNDPTDPTDPSDPIDPVEEETSAALEFIQKYWFALILLTVMIALLSPTKK